MFAAVILGYLVSTLLAFCGLVSVCCFLMDGAYTSKLEFATGLAVASWPLGLAAIIGADCVPDRSAQVQKYECRDGSRSDE